MGKCPMMRYTKIISRVSVGVGCFLIYFLINNQLRSTPQRFQITEHVMKTVDNVPPKTVVPLPQIPSIGESIVNPHDYKIIINEESICHGNVSLVIVVPTAVKNFKTRDVIRNTWGSHAKNISSNVRLVFFVGMDTDESLNVQLANESRYFHDVIQESFIDSYRNLSIKSMGVLKWTRDFCNNAKFLLKADDDMFINVQKLVHDLEQRREKVFIVGAKIVGARPHQNKNSKWYTPNSEFNGTVYPNYVSGTAYSMSTSAVGVLFDVALRTKLFWLEDIFVTGICAVKAKVMSINNNGFTFLKRKFDPCGFRKIISSHRVSSSELIAYHQKMKSVDLKCP